MSEEVQTEKRVCDYCGEAKAVLYCRADSAKLCFSCDREVHSTNQLFSKHTRSLLCDACDSSPASIFCESEHFVFCQNCDWQRHSISSFSLHLRRPFEGFSGCPSVAEFLSLMGFDDDHAKSKALFSSAEEDGLEGFSDILLWDDSNAGVVSMDDLIASSRSEHGFKASVVPSLPKNRNAACGQHKQEILHQLRELEKLESNFNNDYIDMESFIGFQSLLPEEVWQSENVCTVRENNSGIEACKADPTQMFRDSGPTTKHVSDLPNVSKSYIQESFMVSEGHINVGSGVHNETGYPNQQPGQSVKTEIPSVLNSQERGSALSRYKEKRKTRRYEKVVRYESRKVRAQSRTRIRGRFAKINQ